MSYQNKQPYYHRVVILFTSTGETEERFQEFLNNNQTDEFFDFEIEEWDDGEPGDPADLL
jgi:hypothetical protein